MSNDETVKDSHAADSHDIELTPFTIFRYVASMGLLIFLIIIVGALMFTGNTRVADEASPWVALIVCVSDDPNLWLCAIQYSGAVLVRRMAGIAVFSTGRRRWVSRDSGFSFRGISTEIFQHLTFIPMRV